ncbi:hypothetical protein ACFXKC_02025 [Streptomyces sp. NPDC059340]|uniref:hypothetical protein n=1 Tax=Streptomyces sp. NPDC059340 TaxID=3346806 RepID=UPI00368E7838
MVHDAGALIAGGLPLAPAPVEAQAWRDGARQAQSARILNGCEVPVLDHAVARRVEALLGQAATPDPGDIQHLLDRLGPSGKRAEVAPLR